MDVVVLGPSDRSILWRHGCIEESKYDEFVESYARFLAERAENVIVTPDDGVYTDVALRWGVLVGRKPVAYYPDRDETFGIGHIEGNFSSYEVRPIGGDWYTLNAELVTKAPVSLLLGVSPGSLIELSFAKYHQKFKGLDLSVLVDDRCLGSPLHPALEEQVRNIEHYSTMEELAALWTSISSRS